MKAFVALLFLSIACQGISSNPCYKYTDVVLAEILSAATSQPGIRSVIEAGAGAGTAVAGIGVGVSVGATGVGVGVGIAAGARAPVT